MSCNQQVMHKNRKGFWEIKAGLVGRCKRGHKIAGDDTFSPDLMVERISREVQMGVKIFIAKHT